MKTNVCFVYPWATFGGVERVILNRALAFKSYFENVHVDLLFMSDGGGRSALAEAIKRYEVDKTLTIVSSPAASYDLMFVIDCPEAIDFCVSEGRRFVAECHTPYKQNRRYLSELPDICERVVTPSRVFAEAIRHEFPRLKAPVVQLGNFVPWEILPQQCYTNVLPRWDRIPLLFFGRLDRLKDPVSLLNAFEMFTRREKDQYILVFCGPKSSEVNIEREIAKRSLTRHSVVLPPVPFASTGALLESVSRAEGIFVSPSKGESFGLSAAEALSALVPVVLSDIEPHLCLTAGYNELFTYPIANVKTMVKRIEAIAKGYSEARIGAGECRKEFGAKAFVDDWLRLMLDMGID